VKSPFRKALLFFVISRVLLEIIGLLAIFYFPSAEMLSRGRDLRYHREQPRWLEIWARWDSEWYLLIAEKGYSSQEVFRNQGGGRYLPQETSKFFPGYPLAVRLVSTIVRNGVFAGFIVSNTFCILFLWYFCRLCPKLSSDPDSSFRSACYYIIFPTSFFLSAVYSESMFLAAAVAAFYYIEDRRLFPACVCCGIAILTRSQGFLLLAPLVWLAWLRFPEKKTQAALLVGLAGALPLLGYLFYVQQTFGSVRWISGSISYWRGEMKYPFYALVRFFGSHPAIHGQHNSIIDFSFAVLHLSVLVLTFRKLPKPYFLYSLFVLVFPLFSTLFSFSRLCLINFPFFLWLGKNADRSYPAISMIFSMLLAFFMAAFANWYWVG
jgi:Gpi18-like mannosyltransferase